MNTPAHLIFGLTAFGRPGAPAVTWAALAGALLPDLSLYVLSGWELLWKGTSPQVVFDVLYFSEGWQAVFRVDNSFILWGLGLVLALMLRAPVGVALCGAALLHLALDFPVHTEDARAHFWPVTNWKFISPISYWDSGAFGHVVGTGEVLAALACCILLWRRFRGWGMRVLIAALGAMELVPGIGFAILFATGA